MIIYFLIVNDCLQHNLLIVIIYLILEIGKMSLDQASETFSMHATKGMWKINIGTQAIREREDYHAIQL